MDASKTSVDFKESHDIKSYPTIKAYRNGYQSPNYDGEFEVKNLLNWVRERAQYKFVEVVSSDDIEKLFGETDEEYRIRREKLEQEKKSKGDSSPLPEEEARTQTVILAAKSALYNISEMNQLDSIAFRFSNQFKFCKISPKSTIDHFDGLYSFRASYGRFKNNTAPAKYTGHLNDTDSIMAWIVRSSLPNAIYYDDSIMDSLVASQVEIVVFVFIPDDYDREDEIISALNEVGNPSRTDALFAYVGSDHESMMNFFGIPFEFEEPVVKVLQIKSKDDMFVFNTNDEADINKDFLEEVVSAFYDGELEQFNDFEEEEEEFEEEQDDGDNEEFEDSDDEDSEEDANEEEFDDEEEREEEEFDNEEEEDEVNEEEEEEEGEEEERDDDEEERNEEEDEEEEEEEEFDDEDL